MEVLIDSNQSIKKHQKIGFTYKNFKFLAQINSEELQRLEGKFSAFPDGKIFSITNYLEGYRHGEYKVYNQRGKLTTVGHYKLDLKDGIWQNNEGKKEIFNNGILQ